ncbi:hypothetical protein RFI_16042 [Reticulomyxa filosa]|uniref:Uncharacterized protein n=1 Tax=Reticulomyxa filosa TaxID=46433 RepID=X6N772_RETFI|nr:hypothetical protein RFI_16042 [Reticulomyxa filosa]|eukprot:ETO21162.1 hypothetical protein RFI_16042 [Reticulomyxa filosa]
MLGLLLLLSIFWLKVSQSIKANDLQNVVQSIKANELSQFREWVEKSPELTEQKYIPSAAEGKSGEESGKGYTLLDITTIYGRLEMVKYLLDRKAGGNAMESMYYICVDSGEAKAHQRLSEQTQIGFEDREYSTALLDTYLQYKVDINDQSQNPSGMSLLQTCMLNAYIDVTKKLLENSANVCMKVIFVCLFIVCVCVSSKCIKKDKNEASFSLGTNTTFGELLKLQQVTWDLERLKRLEDTDEFTIKHLERLSKAVVAQRPQSQRGTKDQSRDDVHAQTKREQPRDHHKFNHRVDQEHHIDFDHIDKTKRTLDEALSEREKERSRETRVNNEKWDDLKTLRDKKRQEMETWGHFDKEKMKDWTGDNPKDRTVPNKMEKHMKQMRELRDEEEKWRQKLSNDEIDEAQWQSRREELHQKRNKIREEIQLLRHDEPLRERKWKRGVRKGGKLIINRRENTKKWPIMMSCSLCETFSRKFNKQWQFHEFFQQKM